MTFWNDTLRRVGAACAITCTMLGAPAQSWAQGSEQAINSLVSSTVAVYVGLGTTALAVVALPFGLTTTAGGAATKEQGAALERYLRENQFEVRESLATGQGVFVEDLGASLQFSPRERATLGQVLRGERAVLGVLAEPESLTPERAGEFARVLWGAIGAEPTLAAALERRGG